MNANLKERIKLYSVSYACIAMIIICFILALYLLVEEYPIKQAVKPIISDDEFCSYHIINDSSDVVFINTMENKKFIGKYYMFLNKVDNKWVVNESSKTVIW